MMHKTFAYEDLIRFTSKFTEDVGSGGFSNVYKGKLDDDKQVAVKVLKNTLVIGDFMAEMQTMMMASHPNLVTLHGFCFDYNMKALVYEFMEKGSFDKILFDNHLSLEWGELYEIVLETTKGLAYLHCDCAKQIIHCDVKPSNVLIDINLSPKITDFGLAKLISKDADHYTISQNKGTKGYVAPEFGFPLSLITNKCDVYSFGVMLFEVLGKRGNGEFGANWFPVQIWKKFANGQLDELIKSFDIPETHKGKARILSMVAFWCAQYTVEIRPSMSTVVMVLENEIPVNTPPYPFVFQTSLDFQLLPQQEMILKIHSEASSVVQESLTPSNPTPVAASPEEAENDSADEQAMPNFSEQVSSEEHMPSSVTKKLLSELSTYRPQQFSPSDIERFTSNFSMHIGRGGFGDVYKGQLLTGLEVTIEVLHDIHGILDETTFTDVVMAMGRLYHPNIVKLHGYCFDGQMKALVYEFIRNGSLDMLLYRNHRPDIDWNQLYEIAIEIAKGLFALHTVGIIHRDIEASSIFLDSNLSPKITSFELEGLIIMKRDDDAARIIRSIGYSSPEMWMPTSVVTTKSDVYSFGMLLFEVLGRRSISNHRGQEWFPAQVWKMFNKGLLEKLVEDCGINKKDRKKAYNLSKVALWCAQFDPQKRPSMDSVVNMLEMEIPVMDPPNPFPHAQFSSTSSSPEVNPRFNLEASPSVELSSAISNPTLVGAPNVSINAYQKEEKNREAERYSDDEQAISNFTEQVLSEKSKTRSETEKLLSESVTGRPHQFSLSDIESFTFNFSNCIDMGDFGCVYKGQLQNGVEVAIEVLPDIHIIDETTITEVVMTMGKFYHPNIVKLHGYCFDGHLKVLVYEYQYRENGPLDMVLYRNRLHFELEQLYKIVIETAKGLSALHDAGIIHYDINATNIFLNSHHSPRIKYSLKELRERNRPITNISSRVRGRSCYDAPEMWTPMPKVTSKSDVYSFGMLLFEALGRRCISNHRGLEWFPAQVWKMFNKGLLGKVMEDCGVNKKDRKKAYNLSKVALWCAQFDPRKRPSMSSVVKMLEMEIPVMDPPNPFPHTNLPSTSSSPEVNPILDSEASPSIELLSFHQKNSLEGRRYSSIDSDDVIDSDDLKKSQSGRYRDKARDSMLDLFEKNCPPGGVKENEGKTGYVETSEKAEENKDVTKMKVLQAKKLDEKEVEDTGNLRLKFKERKEEQGKKKFPAYNNVIEETASKLAEKRKSKVKALVGAFETVIHLTQQNEGE